MKKAMQVLVTILMAFALLAVVPSCSNTPAPGPAPAAGCQSDNQCNGNDKCMVCTSGNCTKHANGCTTDAECTGGKRCYNVPGKAYGECS